MATEFMILKGVFVEMTSFFLIELEILPNSTFFSYFLKLFNNSNFHKFQTTVKTKEINKKLQRKSYLNQNHVEK